MASSGWQVAGGKHTRNPPLATRHPKGLQQTIMGLFSSLKRRITVADAPETNKELGRVAADASRCVQCGVCGYNCPVGIPVRDYACRGLPVTDPACISCGNCVNVCPRGTLRWETDNHVIVLERFARQMGG
jgi:ferredoxin